LPRNGKSQITSNYSMTAKRGFRLFLKADAGKTVPKEKGLR
jgi:hypothetical protein